MLFGLHIQVKGVYDIGGSKSCVMLVAVEMISIFVKERSDGEENYLQAKKYKEQGAEVS